MILANLIQAYQEKNKLGLRKICKQIGCDHTTLFRVIRGQQVYSDIYVQILRWILSDAITKPATKIRHDKKGKSTARVRSVLGKGKKLEHRNGRLIVKARHVKAFKAKPW